jgi:hypothetical protein
MFLNGRGINSIEKIPASQNVPQLFLAYLRGHRTDHRFPGQVEDVRSGTIALMLLAVTIAVTCFRRTLD